MITRRQQQPLTKELLFRELSRHPTVARWTQSSPIRPDVWFEYVCARGGSISVLVVPYRGVEPGCVYRQLREKGIRSGYNESVVTATISWVNLLKAVLPLSKWWQSNGAAILASAKHFCIDHAEEHLPSDAYHFLRGVGLVTILGGGGARPTASEVTNCCADSVGLAEAAMDVLSGIPTNAPHAEVFAISKNRVANVSSTRSVETIKGDAARRLFDLSCTKLTWAVVDSGIDASHPAFGKGESASSDHISVDQSRVRAAYDFTLLGEIMDLAGSPAQADRERLQKRFNLASGEARDLGRRIRAGREVDWGLLKTALKVSLPYAEALHPHGTHVAGILAGCGGLSDGEDDASLGVCPDINVIDIRVLDREGKGDEFQIIAALQFIRHLNSGLERPVVQGVNLSLQMLHDVREYACGRTPVCEEAERLVASGVVVVASAGNRGFAATGPAVGTIDNDLGGQSVGGYEDISITDPGNAEAVITVGSTHRSEPHTYGVSFFSSRGPTGDGRIKPDLLAPGEKVLGPIPDALYESMDGTSQAAPHISGAAALLMARNRELIGRPVEIKDVLLKTATDLGRKSDFQGRGLVDVLRALQAR